jgi:hypothetical protein
MPHRMDVELTSARDDETFTWRAAGARQPKGAVAASLLPKGAKVGDVVRIEAEVEIDGITVLAVLPPKEKDAPRGLIEVVGTQRPVAGVTTVLAGPVKGRRENRFFRDGEERKPARPGGDRRPRRDGEGPADSRSRPAAAVDAPAATEGDGRPPRGRPEGDRASRGRGRPGSEVASARRDLGGPRTEGAGAGSRGGRPEGRPSSSRPGGPPRRETGSREEHAGRPGGSRPQRPPRGPFRLEPGSKHRDDLMATLPAEQQLIADRLATGGLPAVRKAIADEQERATAEGRPPVAADSILALAEQLQPDVKAAVWMDRAEAALAHLDELGLRDLRAAVVAATPRDDAGRHLERQLREGLERRVNKLRSDWEQLLSQSIADGKILQALRLSARPPEPTARFPAALIERLTTQVSAAMSAETSPDRWLALLDAAAACPVRRQIKPAGIPEDPSGEVQRKAREAAGRIPALAPMLGMAMPPPPKPVPGERISRPGSVRPPRPPRPQRPPRPPARHATATAPVPAPSAPTAVVEAPAAVPQQPFAAAPDEVPEQPAAAAPAPLADEPTPVLETPAPAQAPETPAALVTPDEPIAAVPAPEPTTGEEPTAGEAVPGVHPETSEVSVTPPSEQAGPDFIEADAASPAEVNAQQ